jgi:hypothetical protein
MLESAKAACDIESLQLLWDILVEIPDEKKTIEGDIFFTWLKT